MKVSQEKNTVKELLGIHREGIIWGRLSAFFYAYLLSALFIDILQILSRPLPTPPSVQFIDILEIFSRSLPFAFDSWSIYIVLLISTSFIFTACAAAGFHFVQGIYPAITVSAVAYCILGTVIRSFLIIKLMVVFTIIFSWCWIFLVLTGLHLSIRQIKKTWLALMAAYFSAYVILRIINIAMILIYNRIITNYTVQSELNFLVFSALKAAAFGGLFWIGLQRPGSRWELAAVPAAAPGIARPDRPGAWESHKLSELKKAADSRMIQKMLLPAAIGSIIFGIIAIIIGMGGGQDAHPINIILAFIGMALIVVGTWCAAAPNPLGLRVDGIALTILGVWNILVIILNLSYGVKNMSWFILVGLWQITWGIHSIKRSKYYYYYLSGMTINQESLQELNNIANNINQASVKEDESMIEFRIKTLFHNTLLKGKLLEGMILFVGPKGTFYMDKISKIEIRPFKTISTAYPAKASLNICGHTLVGEIPRKLMDRYQRWK